MSGCLSATLCFTSPSKSYQLHSAKHTHTHTQFYGPVHGIAEVVNSIHRLTLIGPIEATLHLPGRAPPEYSTRLHTGHVQFMAKDSREPQSKSSIKNVAAPKSVLVVKGWPKRRSRSTERRTSLQLQPRRQALSPKPARRSDHQLSGVSAIPKGCGSPFGRMFGWSKGEAKSTASSLGGLLIFEALAFSYSFNAG